MNIVASYRDLRKKVSLFFEGFGNIEWRLPPQELAREAKAERSYFLLPMMCSDPTSPTFGGMGNRDLEDLNEIERYAKWLEYRDVLNDPYKGGRQFDKDMESHASFYRIIDM